MENYFNYFTEIEEHFQQRRGTGLLLSTLDWALIETWKDAGIPLEAVLRGIDVTFDHYERRPSKAKKVNALGFCAQEVLAAAESMQEAAVGTAKADATARPGFQPSEIAAFLRRSAEHLENAKLPNNAGVSAQPVAIATAKSLCEMAAELESGSAIRLEDLERRLTVAEDKLFGVLFASVPDEDVVNARAEADREMTPYRSKMPAAQIEMLQKQFVRKRLLERYGLPRLSLFYM